MYNLFIRDNDYRQLVNRIYTNLPELQTSYQVLETDFSDHKAVCVILNCFNGKLTKQFTTFFVFVILTNYNPFCIMENNF